MQHGHTHASDTGGIGRHRIRSAAQPLRTFRSSEVAVARHAIRELHAGEMRKLARKALMLPTAAEIEEFLMASLRVPLKN